MRQLPAMDSRSWKQTRGISWAEASQACSKVYSGGTSISLPSTISLVMPPRSSLRASGAPRRLPQPRRRQAFPAGGVLARPVLPQMVKPLNSLLHCGPVSGRYPPHHKVALVHPLKPFVAPAIEALMQGLPNEPLERLHAVPYRQVDRHARVFGKRARFDRASAVVLVAPNKSRAALGQPVHEREIVDEFRHTRIASLVTQAADIELREVKLCHGLCLCYSAATATGSGCGFALYSSMRRSISGRKWRSRPCTGQAAPSPNAQMVWPSIWVVTSISMSISRLCARPSAMRVSTRHIQPMPSRQGVHWPPLSCL